VDNYRFRNFPLLWASCSAFLFVVIGSVVWPGPVQSSYFGRLADPGSAGLSVMTLIGQGVMYAGMAAVFGWMVHALVIVGMATLTGGPSFTGVSPEAALVDECYGRLHASGWSVGESCFLTNSGIVWQVDGTNGANRLLARGPSQAAAWRSACEQAAAAGIV
jgi:hypothetical protein